MKGSRRWTSVIAISIAIAIAGTWTKAAEVEPNIDEVLDLIEQGQMDRALEKIAEANDQTRKGTQWRMLEAVTQAKSGNAAIAQSMFEKIATEAPETPSVFENLAVVQAIQGNFQGALRSAKEAVQRKNDEESWTTLGGIYDALAENAYMKARTRKNTGWTAAMSTVGQTKNNKIGKTRRTLDDPPPMVTSGMEERTRTKEKREEQEECPPEWVGKTKTQRKAAAEEKRWKSKTGRQTSLERIEGGRTLYWTMLRKAEQEEYEVLKDQEKLGEHAIVTRGKHQGRISFGLFSKQTNAETRRQKVELAGLETEIVMEKRTGWRVRVEARGTGAALQESVKNTSPPE